MSRPKIGLHLKTVNHGQKRRNYQRVFNWRDNL